MTQKSQASSHTVALIGAGAVGLSLAAALVKAGVDVAVCGARTPFNDIIVNEGGKQNRYPVRHITVPEELGLCHMAVLAVKAHHTDDVESWLQHFDQNDAVILAAQNGLGHKLRVAKYAPQAEVLPAIIYLNVERSSPGHVILRRVTDCDVCVPQTAMGAFLISSLIKGGMRVRQVGDMTTVIWTKLLSNIAVNPITALTGRRADVMRDPLIEQTGRQIMQEALLVGLAEGAKLSENNIEEAMTWLQSVPPGSTTSMREDRQAGRPLEYEALTGAVVDAADRHGIDVPYNRFLLSLLMAIKY